MATTTKKAAAKPAAKKTTTAKPAAKKTTATAKPAAKKATATAKPAAKSTEISVTSNKRIETICREFTETFPYLMLGVYYHCTKEKTAVGEAIPASYMIDKNRKLSDARSLNTSGCMTISSRMKISSVEKEFQSVFGLHCQVCYIGSDGLLRYTHKSQDDKTLAAFNAECEKNGCKKGEWK